MAMYAGVPVEASIKGGMIEFRFYGQGCICECHTCLIRELPLHASEGEVGEVDGALQRQLIFTIFQLEMKGCLGGGVEKV
jgi:hypothetical protein